MNRWYHITVDNICKGKYEFVKPDLQFHTSEADFRQVLSNLLSSGVHFVSWEVLNDKLGIAEGDYGPRKSWFGQADNMEWGPRDAWAFMCLPRGLFVQ